MSESLESFRAYWAIEADDGDLEALEYMLGFGDNCGVNCGVKGLALKSGKGCVGARELETGGYEYEGV